MNPKITTAQILELSECYEKQVGNLTGVIDHIVLTTLIAAFGGGSIDPLTLMQEISAETLAVDSEMMKLRQKIEELKSLLKE